MCHLRSSDLVYHPATCLLSSAVSSSSPTHLEESHAHFWLCFHLHNIADILHSANKYVGNMTNYFPGGMPFVSHAFKQTLCHLWHQDDQPICTTQWCFLTCRSCTTVLKVSPRFHPLWQIWQWWYPRILWVNLLCSISLFCMALELRDQGLPFPSSCTVEQLAYYFVSRPLWLFTMSSPWNSSKPDSAAMYPRSKTTSSSRSRLASIISSTEPVLSAWVCFTLFLGMQWCFSCEWLSDSELLDELSMSRAFHFALWLRGLSFGGHERTSFHCDLAASRTFSVGICWHAGWRLLDIVHQVVRGDAGSFFFSDHVVYD